MLFIEQQVTSKEISEKLFSLNIDLKTLFYWEVYSDTAYGLKYFPHCLAPETHVIPSEHYKKYAAYTPSDLMFLLPNTITIEEGKPFNNFRIGLKKITIIEKSLINDDILINAFVANYFCDSTACVGADAWMIRQLFKESSLDKNLSNCLGKLLINVRKDERIK